MHFLPQIIPTFRKASRGVLAAAEGDSETARARTKQEIHPFLLPSVTKHRKMQSLGEGGPKQRGQTVLWMKSWKGKQVWWCQHVFTLAQTTNIFSILIVAFWTLCFINSCHVQHVPILFAPGGWRRSCKNWALQVLIWCRHVSSVHFVLLGMHFNIYGGLNEMKSQLNVMAAPMPQYESGYLNCHTILWARLLPTGAEPLESLLNPSLRWSHEKELLLGWICHANVPGKYTDTQIGSFSGLKADPIIW